MRQRDKIALAVLGGAALSLVVMLAEPPDPAPKPRQPENPPKPVEPPKENPNGTDDETALARMLASEDDDNESAQIVIGWLAIQTAKRRKQSLFDRLTDGKGYGLRVIDGKSRYAATHRAPTPQTRRTAAALLAGEVLPSAAIREHPAASWVELDKKKKDTDEAAAEILRQQRRFGRIWGRIAGTRWYLFDEKLQPSLAWTKATAKKVLGSVPSIPATEL